mmetsp:Transcript_4761/g.8314  ORF Transcript_4761/g.8314 Transcript_4761/m.8314 type:complete len:94 (-) Transcript_4761:1760-2041(-)
MEWIRKLSEGHERLKHKIHNTRFPIKDKRLFMLAQVGYFVVPIVGGCMVMNWTGAAQRADDMNDPVKRAQLLRKYGVVEENNDIDKPLTESVS